MAARKKFVGGNWKCNGTRESVASLITIYNNVATEGMAKDIDVVVAPTALHIPMAVDALHADIQVSAQNIWSASGYGAYTGELTADMVVDFGLKWAITGHSERRHKVSAESDALVAEKTKAGLNSGLNVIMCIGETLAQREEDKTMAVLQAQLEPALALIPADSAEWDRVVVAYEPVWAIGTGRTASPAQAEEVHAGLRAWLSSLGDAGATLAGKLRIIYGGSVKPANATELIAQPNIDGFLVGGCSLKQDIQEICRAVNV